MVWTRGWGKRIHYRYELFGLIFIQAPRVAQGRPHGHQQSERCVGDRLTSGARARAAACSRARTDARTHAHRLKSRVGHDAHCVFMVLTAILMVERAYGIRKR